MAENTGFFELEKRVVGESGESDGSEIPEKNGFRAWKKCADDDPMLLSEEVMQEVKAQFEARGLSLSGSQRDAISRGNDAVLSAKPDTVTINAMVPGGGKSTYILALLTVLARLFVDMSTALARRIGGVILVVETSLEAWNIKNRCDQEAGTETAVVIEGPNDSVLKQQGCPNGTATTYEECLRHSCPDHNTCPRMLAAHRTEETPILIMLHARYKNHLEVMSPFTVWYDEDGNEYRRSLLLVDELPDLFEDGKIDLLTLNEAENEIDQIKASYLPQEAKRKRELLYSWDKLMRWPFKRLVNKIWRDKHISGIISQKDLEEAGFDKDVLMEYGEKFHAYAVGTKAEQIVKYILADTPGHYNIGKSVSLFRPRLKKFDVHSGLATVIFSGTAYFASELKAHKDRYTILNATLGETYERLHIRIQRGDDFSTSRTGLNSSGSMAAYIELLKDIIAQESQFHQKILLVTYKEYKKMLWECLKGYHNVLLPHIDKQGKEYQELPYFGGMTGSNEYLAATCVIYAGLHRKEPAFYLSHALALDPGGETAASIEAESSGNACSPEQTADVMRLQDITLAADIVQDVYRSRLRIHGDGQPITLWLIQPPNGTVAHVVSYFQGCQVEEITQMPEACRVVKTTSRRYRGNSTHASKLLSWLQGNWDGAPITPEEIRQATGLTQAQFKEAKKHPEIRAFFENEVFTQGNGKNTVYSRKPRSTQSGSEAA